MGEVIPFDRRTEAERQLADALKAEAFAQKAYESAIDRVAYWTGVVALERRPLHVVPDPEPEPIAYADPITRIHDMTEVWEDGSV